MSVTLLPDCYFACVTLKALTKYFEPNLATGSMCNPDLHLHFCGVSCMLSRCLSTTSVWRDWLACLCEIVVLIMTDATPAAFPAPKPAAYTCKHTGESRFIC